MPAWQATALAGSGCSKRATVDISAAATMQAGSVDQGVAVYQAGWLQVEGTVVSAPIVAAILTRLGLAVTISNDLAWPYANPTGLNDLGSASYPVDVAGVSTNASTGTTHVACGVLCNVGSGWDGPSGMGTPNGAQLVALGGTGSSSSSGGVGEQLGIGEQLRVGE